MKVAVKVLLSLHEGEQAYELTPEEAERLYQALRIALKKDQDKQPYMPTIQPRWDPPPIYKDPWVYPIITCEQQPQMNKEAWDRKIKASTDDWRSA